MESYTNHEGDVITVGTIVTAYRPGYHVVTKITDRSKLTGYMQRTDSPLISYKPLLTSKGTKAPNSPQQCDAAYCRLASKRIPEEIKELERRIEALTQFQFDYDI